jgi:glycogen synthase
VARYNLAGRTVIGSIGYSSSDGIECLIDAVLLLLGERPELVLLLAGEAGTAEREWERIPECWHNHFIFAGKVPYHEMHRYYSVMDLLVYPRRRSRLTELSPPLNPLEAMAMGRPVIGSDLGVIRELLNDGERGILVEPEDSGAMAVSLARLVDDRALRHSIGGRAREFVERERTWGKIVERYLPIYEKAMKSARGMREPGE